MKEARVVDKVTYLLKTIATNIKDIQETKTFVNDELFNSNCDCDWACKPDKEFLNA